MPVGTNDSIAAYSVATAEPGDPNITLDITGTADAIGQAEFITNNHPPNEPTPYEDYENVRDTGVEIKGSDSFPEPPDPNDGDIELNDQEWQSVLVTHRTSHQHKWWRKVSRYRWSSISGNYGPPPNYPEESIQGMTFESDNLPVQLGAEIIDPIVEPSDEIESPYFYTNPFVSIEDNGYWKAGGTYDVTVYETEEYEGYFAGYLSNRTSGLLGTGSGGSVAGLYFNSKEGLINDYGIANLFDTVRTFGSSFYQAFPTLVNDSVTSGIIASVTPISETAVEDTTGDQDTDYWYRKRTYQRTYRFVLSSTAPTGTHYLVSTLFKNDTIEDFDTGDAPETWVPELETAIMPININTAPPFPRDRLDDYDPDKEWDPDTETWVDQNALTTLGGGRYNKQFVAVGHKKIYFSSL